MKNLSIYFIPWILLLCACGEDEVKFKPGPILSDVIHNRENDKKAAADVDRRTKRIEGQMDEEVMPIVVREQTALTQLQQREALLDQAGFIAEEDLIEDPLTSPLEILPYELPISETENIPVILIRGKLINLERLKRAISINSSHIAEADASKEKIDHVLFANSPLNPQSDNLPIVLSGVRVELHEEDLIETHGRDLWIVTEKMIYEGKISLRPPKADFEQAGKNSGSLYLYSPVLETGPKAELDLTGGDAGDFHAEVPWATKEQLADLHAKAIQMAFDFKTERDQEIDWQSDPNVKKILREKWNQIRREVPSDDLPVYMPWEEYPGSDESYPAHWVIKVFRSGKRGDANGRYPIVPIPELEFKSDIKGGNAGEFIYEVLRGSASDISLIQESGKNTDLKNMRRPKFKIRDRNKIAEHEEEFHYRIQVTFAEPQFERRISGDWGKRSDHGSDGSVDVTYHFDGYELHALSPLESSKLKVNKTWMDISSGSIETYQVNPSHNIKTAPLVKNWNWLFSIKELNQIYENLMTL